MEERRWMVAEVEWYRHPTSGQIRKRILRWYAVGDCELEQIRAQNAASGFAFEYENLCPVRPSADPATAPT